MQITLNLDEALLKEAFQLTNLSTQEELLNLALQEFVRARRKKNLLDLAGQIEFASDFDHKALRETRHAAVKKTGRDPYEAAFAAPFYVKNPWKVVTERLGTS